LCPFFSLWGLFIFSLSLPVFFFILTILFFLSPHPLSTPNSHSLSFSFTLFLTISFSLYLFSFFSSKTKRLSCHSNLSRDCKRWFFHDKSDYENDQYLCWKLCETYHCGNHINQFS
jgi:hypothetical protein